MITLTQGIRGTRFTRFAFISQMVWLLGSAAWSAGAATPPVIPDEPLFTALSASPVVMLDVSRDHQLFYKAYNDYSDLDGDGTPETTYAHTLNGSLNKYYGYFDPTKCYDYSSNVFTPSGLAGADNYCSGNWSGNFLNWVTMSRADIMRKVLFGGKRSSDSTTETILERATLPQDAHSWAKYYNGSDLNKLTPFTSEAAPSISFQLAKSSTNSGATLSIAIGSGLKARLGDQIDIYNASTRIHYYGVVTAINAAGDTPTLSFGETVTIPKTTALTATNLSHPGISFCNTSSGDTRTSTTTPLMRAARGNYALWNANEKYQCYWRESKSATMNPGSNGNRYGKGSNVLSELAASAENPSSAEVGLGSIDYTVRIKACMSKDLIGSETCTLYDQIYKPTGLLQKYGEGANPRIFFGLMTGSFAKNISGGVLRKNANVSLSGNTPSSADEINPSTGQFISSTQGIISSLSALKIYGFDPSGFYLSGDSCNYQQIGMVHSGGTNAQGYPATEGNCSSWGNPMSEVYIESLRYLAGKTSATSDFTYSHSGSHDEAVGLAKPSAWKDPLNAKNYCAPLNVLMFNASVSSYDNDQANSPFAELKGSPSLSTWTDAVGSGEGITKAYIGSNGTTFDGLCTAKDVTSLSSLSGICPEAPSLQGSYFMAGAAYFAHRNAIRNSAAADPSKDKSPYTVTTYGVQLATSVPRITIPIGDKNVVLQPAYRLNVNGKYGTGTIVDFKIVRQDATSGRFYVNWEDSNQGGDYDQDVIGFISYTVDTNSKTLTVTTQVISASTANPQGFGYTIAGTNKDGVHFHSGIIGFNYTDSTGVTGCSNCNVGDTAVSYTYSLGTSAVKSLEDPMYYAAKWGGFDTSTGETSPTAANKSTTWDEKKVDGSLGGDGQPDTYYYVNNPGALAASLDNAFKAISGATSASAVATNSASLQNGTMLYQARFNPSNWSGDMLAYSIDPATGAMTQKWQVQTAMASVKAADRRIFTTKPGTGGVEFLWANLSATQQSLLGSEEVLNYLRGDQSKEGTDTNKFRTRASIIGDIVDSNPVYAGKPSGQYNEANRFFSAYWNADFLKFRTSNKDRTPVVYVGANDGMIHAFNASTGTDAGKEIFAYVPALIYENLAGLKSQAYDKNHRFFVNGSPEVADAQIGTAWKTVLVSGLRKGGKGVFALDVTTPSSFSGSNVLWEFSSSDDADLGYVYGTPVIAKMANGKWVAVFGNGYNSAHDKAFLFILALDKGTSPWALGTNYWKIEATTDTATSSNIGLGPVAPFDIEADGIPDAFYAGDLNGNMWKFDVTNSLPSNWKLAFSGAKKPLAIACTEAPCTDANRRPITNTPAITRHPTNLDTPIVYFGSGKYLEKEDTQTTAIDSMYGVWDNNAPTSRANYLSQLISPDRTVTNNAITWATAADTNYTGWVESFPIAGERQTGTPSVLGGIVFYNTFIPSTSLCDYGGTGYLMAVNYTNGGRTQLNVFQGKDNTVSGVEIGVALGGSLIIPPGESGIAVAISNLTDPEKKTPDEQKLNPNAFLGSRISWREVIQK